MATQTFENLGPIYTTAAKYETMKTAGTLEVGREYKIIDWEAQEKISDLDTIRSGAALGATAIQEHQSLAEYRKSADQDVIDATKQAKLTAGTGIDITNNTISLNSNSSIAIYDNRISDANEWLTNGYTKTSAAIPTANLPAVCTGMDRWGVLLYVAENNTNHAGLQQYFPVDGTYSGRVFYRSVTGYDETTPPDFGEWNLVPWTQEKQDTLVSGTNIKTINNESLLMGSTNASDIELVTPSEISDMATKTYADDKYEPWLGDKGKVPEWKTEDPGAGQALHIPYNFVFTPDANKLDIKMYTVTADGNNTYNEWDNTVPPANSIEAMSYANAGLMTSADATAVRTTIPTAIATKQDTLTASTGIDITNNTVKAVGVEYKNNDIIQSNALKFVRLTQTQYDALTTKDTDTLYMIIGE